MMMAVRSRAGLLTKEPPEGLLLETQAWKAAIARKPFGPMFSNKLAGTEGKLVGVHYKAFVNTPEKSSEGPASGVRLHTRKICRWRDGKMVLQWAAAALLMTEQNFCKIIKLPGPLDAESRLRSRKVIRPTRGFLKWIRTVAHLQRLPVHLQHQIKLMSAQYPFNNSVKN